MKSKRKMQDLTGSELLDSLKISENFYTKQENRVLTLLLKGLIVYLVTAGSIGGTLTATGTAFNQLIFNLVVFALSMIIGLIYYNKKTENVGDILYFIAILFFGIYLGAYINSGFYAWMNDVIGSASVYFDLPDIGGYNQAIKNNNLTVTIAACYLGAVVVILVNMSVAKRMMYGDLILDALIILFLPLYFKKEPSYLYFALLITGIIFAAIWKSTGRYEKINNNSIYIRTKKEITYTYSFKAHLMAFAQIFICIVIILSLLYVLIPKDKYDLHRVNSSAKEYTDDLVETFITSGIAGFFNRYDNTAGMSSGRLGGVNSVRLDYETNLKITFVPYEYEPIYIRTFIGGAYQPYSNMWSVADPTKLNRNEYDMLNEEYINRNPYSGRGKMIIQNLDAEFAEYSLYYSAKNEYIKTGSSAERLFYPNYEDIGATNNLIMSEEERQYWLSVPNDNVPSIINTLNKINIPQNISALEKADYIKYYYLNNIPYTLRPGSTPYRKDFVNYFLDTAKKGYCVHFASAATLMFRYMGIPARYVEGYVFDYSESSKTSINQDYSYDDLYEGYNPLGEMPVLDAELSDASGHAWVEIYLDNFGWVPVELTPPSSDTEEVSGEGLLSRLLNRLNSNTEIDENNNAAGFNGLSIDTVIVRKIIVVILFVILFITVVYYTVVYIVFVCRYNKADINTKLIIKYHSFIKKKTKKNKELLSLYNYSDQLTMLYDNDDELKVLIDILNKAGFSNVLINDKEFSYCMNFFKKRR